MVIVDMYLLAAWIRYQRGLLDYFDVLVMDFVSLSVMLPNMTGLDAMLTARKFVCICFRDMLLVKQQSVKHSHHENRCICLTPSC